MRTSRTAYPLNWRVMDAAEAVAAAIGGAAPAEVPAAGAVGRDATVWLLDADAASKLKR